MAPLEPVREPAMRCLVDRVIAAVPIHDDPRAGLGQSAVHGVVCHAIDARRQIGAQESGFQPIEIARVLACDIPHIEMRHVARAGLRPWARIERISRPVWRHRRTDGDELAPPCPHRRTGERRDGRAVHAAAEEQPDRMNRPCGRGMRPPRRESCDTSRRNRLRRGRGWVGSAAGVPVAVRANRSVGQDRQNRATRKRVDALEQCAPRRAAKVEGEPAAELEFGRFRRGTSASAHKPFAWLAKAKKPAPRMVTNRTVSHVIAGERQLLQPTVPDREGEIAEQMGGAILAPVLVAAAIRALSARRANEVSPMSSARASSSRLSRRHIGDDRDVVRDDRLAIEGIFMRDAATRHDRARSALCTKPARDPGPHAAWCESGVRHRPGARKHHRAARPPPMRSRGIGNGIGGQRMQLGSVDIELRVGIRRKLALVR